MPAAPFISFNTICLAAPVIGQPCLLMAVAGQPELISLDMINPNQSSAFVKVLTHVVEEKQTEIQGFSFIQYGEGTIQYGAITMLVDNIRTYTTNALQFINDANADILLQGGLDQSYVGRQFALEVVLQGYNLVLRDLEFQLLAKEG